MSINELQDEVIAEFSDFDDWMDRYQLLIDLGNEQEPLEEKYKTEQNLIEGCQSRVWLHVCISIQSERGEVKTSLFYCCFWEVRWFMVSMIPINRRIDPNRTMRYGVPLIRSSIFSASGYLMLR